MLTHLPAPSLSPRAPPLRPQGLADTPQTQEARLYLAKWFKDTRNLNPATE